VYSEISQDISRLGLMRATPSPRYLFMSDTGWIAWTAIGTLDLACATVAAIIVTVRQARKDTLNDDAQRAAERERGDRLRREAAEERASRDNAERRAREDYEARQVLIGVEAKERPGTGHNFNRRVTLSTPHAYPIKQVDGCYACPSNGGLGIVGFGHAGDEPYVDAQRVYYAFWAEVPGAAVRPEHRLG
jgi:hypothetical protein